MKKLLTLAILLIAFVANADHYNINDRRRVSQLPEYDFGTRPYRSATWRHHSDGWRTVIPCVVPDGYVANGNRRTEVVDDQALEVFDVITDAESQAAIVEANRDLWESENAFLAKVATVNATYNLNIDSTDGFQEVMAKLVASTTGTQIDRVQAGLELRTLWDVVDYNGGEWGAVEWHSEVAE